MDTRSSMPLERFLAAFDLEGFGESKIKLLVDAGYNTLDQFASLDPAAIGKINGWSEESAC